MSCKNLPACNVTECFGYEDRHCVVLTDRNFGGKTCPFFKTKEQAAEELAYCKKRLADIRKGNTEE